MQSPQSNGAFSFGRAGNGFANASFLSALRRASGLTLLDIAQRVGVNPTTVLRWERGERVPGAANARALERVLGLPADTLLAPGSYEVAVIR